MARSLPRPLTADQRIRDLRKEFRGFDREEPGPDRAARLAGFTRAAHTDRQLNMAMHAAALCLAEDPDQPRLLLAAYDGADGPEEQLRAYDDLRDLSRYVDRPDLAEEAERRMLELSHRWVADGDDVERRYRLRTVQQVMSREVADDIRDVLGGRH